MEKTICFTQIEINYNTIALFEVAMSIHIVVKLAGNFAKEAYQKKLISPELAELSEVQKRLGIVLEPVHPGSDDSNLISFFIVKVPDLATGKLVLERLGHCKAVDAAYIKPTDDLPGVDH
jgi:hypothetical protein